MKRYVYRWIIAATISVYIYFLVRYSVNIPYADDFDAIYNRFLRFDVLSWWAKFLHFFSLHNEHRIVWNHFVQYIVSLFSHAINIKTIIYLGNFSLVFILLFFWKAIKWSYKLFLFTIVTLLLVNLRYAESSFFAMAVLSNLWVIVFTLRAIYFAINDGKYNYIFAIFFGIVAIWTQWNGILALLIIIFISLLKKQYKYSILYSIVCVSFLLLYFIWYQTPEGSVSIVHNIVLLFSYPQNLFFPFAFLWNIFWAPSYYFTEIFKNLNIASWLIYIPPILIWFGFMWYFIYITFRKKYYKQNLLLYSTFVFVIANVLLLCLSRVIIWYDWIVTSRYTIYSILFLCLIVISSQEMGLLNSKKLLYILIFSITVNVFFSIFTYYFWLLPNSQERINFMQLYINNEKSKAIDTSTLWWWTAEGRVLEILDQSIEKWYYMPPK